jgi:hypothetical protein
MAKLRIYREFYRINYVDGVNDVYTSIDPFSLSASTFNNFSNAFIESPTVSTDGVGSYYVDLNPSLYIYPNMYVLRWYVKYLNNNIQKMLRTKFIFDPITQSFITELDIEFYNNTNLTYEIESDTPLEYEINN